MSKSPGRSALGLRLFQARSALEGRLGRKVPQTEVGEILGVHGVTVGGWESGKSEPSLAMLGRLADLYGVSPAWLAWGIVSAPLKAAEPGQSNAVPVVGTTSDEPSDAPAEPPPQRPHKEVSRHAKAPLIPIRKDDGKGRKKA